MKNNLAVTKDELEKALTELEARLVVQMVTKAEAKNFATKEELKSEIAKLDKKIDQTERLLKAEIRQTAEEVKEDIREEIKQSSSKILDVLDGFLGEIKNSREERELSAYRLSNHDDRITVLEQKAGAVTI